MQRVKLKNYTPHKPKPGNTALWLSVLAVVFAIFLVAKLSDIHRRAVLPYCDYGEPSQHPTDCVPCPSGQYCVNGKIIELYPDRPYKEPSPPLAQALRRFMVESAKVLFIFAAAAALVLAFAYRKKWTDQHIVIAETLYKELLLELSGANPPMVAKSAFARKLDRNYSPAERKFLERKLEEIRVQDEQVTFVNEDGALFYVFTSN